MELEQIGSIKVRNEYRRWQLEGNDGTKTDAFDVDVQCGSSCQCGRVRSGDRPPTLEDAINSVKCFNKEKNQCITGEGCTGKIIKESPDLCIYEIDAKILGPKGATPVLFESASAFEGKLSRIEKQFYQCVQTLEVETELFRCNSCDLIHFDLSFQLDADKYPRMYAHGALPKSKSVMVTFTPTIDNNAVELSATTNVTQFILKSDKLYDALGITNLINQHSLAGKYVLNDENGRLTYHFNQLIGGDENLVTEMTRRIIVAIKTDIDLSHQILDRTFATS